MGFMNSVATELNDGINNRKLTENGAVGFRTTGKNLLDLNFAVSSLRNKSEKEIVNMFIDAFLDNKLYAVKWLFYLRDAREGLGERRSFRVIMNYLADNEPEIAQAVAELIPEYGRFDDLYCFFGTKSEKIAFSVIKRQLNADLKAMKKDNSVSLLGKWLPSCNASSAQTRERGRKIRHYLGLKEREYRKMLSGLRAYINVVERQMSNKQWSEINYEAVPSRANLIYNSAFLRNDEDRRREYLSKLEKGEVKINSSVNFPHDIVHKYADGGYWGDTIKAFDPALEGMWKSLPDLVKENGNTLVVRDGSGSMTCTVDPNSHVRAIQVATALAVYFSEHCSGEFKDQFITFSNRPKLVDMSNLKTLRDKLVRCYRETECSNTDIEKTFKLILDTAVKNNMTQEDLPKNVLIISDMEFDYATTAWSSGLSQTLFQSIEKSFRRHGYDMPRLVFWNVNSRTGTIPVKENKLGVALVSGFSVNVCKMVLSGELDPYKCLIEQLDVERYAPVEAAVRDLF